MQNTNDDALARLQSDWPRWEIWIVYKYIGGPTWCARLHDNHTKIINADSAEHLAEYLEDEVSDPAEEIPQLDMQMTGAMLAEMYPAWTIERNPLGVWTAELISGSEVRYLVAEQAWELALKIRSSNRKEDQS
jgi:hypothetical protein